MAYQYNSNIWSRIRPKIQQWESVSGRRVSPSVLREWIDAELGNEARTATASRGLDIQQQQVDINKEKMENEAKAAPISGIANLATTGIGMYGLGKEAGLWGGTKAIGTTGLSTGATAPTIAEGAQTQLATPITTTALGTTAPATEGVIGPGTSAVPSTTSIGLGTGLGIVGSAGALGGALGSKLSENELIQKTTPWGGENTERMAGSVGMGMAAGAIAGSQIGSIGGPWGAGIGAVVGGIVGWAGGGCIIVTACHGKDSKEVQITREYRDKFMDKDSIRGYYMIAEKVVPIMQMSEELTDLVKFALVDKLIEYGKFKLGYEVYLNAGTVEVAETFLSLCKKTGQSVTDYKRINGEVV